MAVASVIDFSKEIETSTLVETFCVLNVMEWQNGASIKSIDESLVGGF